MQIQFDLTLDDFLAFNRYCAQRSPVYQRNYRFMLISVPLLLFVIALVVSISTSVSPWIIWVLALALTVSWLVRFPILYSKWLDVFVTKTMSMGRNRSMLGKHILSLTEQGVHEISEVGEMSTSWSGVERLEQDENYVYIFLGAISAYQIPKRAFANEQHVLEFCDTAKMSFDRSTR